MFKFLKSFSAIFFVISLFFVFSFCAYVLAQSSPPQLTPEQRAALETELADIEKQIADQQQILDQKRQEGTSISRDIAILDAQIKQAQLKIQAHTLAINQLGKDITVKTQVISDLSNHIREEQGSLSEILRQVNQLDSYSLAEAMLSRKNLSEFLLDMDSLATLNTALKTRVDQVQSDKNQNEKQKTSLNQKRDQEIDTRVDVQNEQNKIKSAQAQKKQLLSLNQAQQKNYQAVIGQKQAEATKIRDALFGLRDVPAIKFGDALTYAQAAQKVTGVDPAFLLAIITQESNLGANVGACFLKDATGMGVRVSTGAIVAKLMKPDRDLQPFMEITTAVGRDPYQTKVSCPLSTGYGGAMGPAQFIPSTWQLNAARIAQAVGKAAADPWSPQDAIMASALYLQDLGAVGGSYTSQIRAACKYYGSGGSSCSYGTQVMSKVPGIQANINILANT